jgi:hypothetical protein
MALAILAASVNHPARPPVLILIDAPFPSRLSRHDYYLDEFTFRFNRRHSKARGLLFHRLAEQAVAVGPAPYRAIIGKPARPDEPTD